MSDNAGRIHSGAEGESSSTTEERLLSRGPVVLHLALRVGLGTLGLAMLVAAVLSLRRDNELGTVAVCLVGAAMVLVGAMGRWPSRISWGDRSAEWAEEVLERAVESGSDETRAEIAHAARSVEEHLLPVKLSTMNPLGEAMGVLFRVLPPGYMVASSRVPDDLGVDLVVRPEASADRNRAIAVEVKKIRGHPSRRLRELRFQATRYLEGGYGAVLILTDPEISGESQDLVTGDQSVFYGLRRARNQRLAEACRWWAFNSLLHSAGALAYYRRRRAAGDTHEAALRRLGSKLVGQLHHCLRHREPYREDIAWPTSQPTAA